MTSDDFLSRLSAGLDRDAEIARAAGEVDGANWYPVDPMSSGSPDRVEGSGDGAVGYDMYETVPPHVARQDPARTLRQVEAIREPLEVFRSKAADLELAIGDGDQTYAAYSEGYRDACLMFVRALASIYADPAEERA